MSEKFKGGNDVEHTEHSKLESPETAVALVAESFGVWNGPDRPIAPSVTTLPGPVWSERGLENWATMPDKVTQGGSKAGWRLTSEGKMIREKAKKEMERRQDPEVVEARAEEFQALATKIFQKLGVVDFDLKFVKDNKEAYGHLPDGSYLIVSTYGGKAGNYGPGKEVKKALSDFPVSVNDFQPGGPGHQYEVYITLSLSK